MNSETKPKLPKGIGMLLGIIIGLAIGYAYGTLMLGSFINISGIGSVIGISMGVGIGIAIGAALEWKNKSFKPTKKSVNLLIWLVVILFLLEMASLFLIYYFLKS